MSNNITLNAGSGGSTLATEQNGVAEQYQKIKITDGTGGAFTNMAAVTAAGALKVDASGAAVPITDNAGSLTVDNAGTFAVQATIGAGSAVIGHVIADSGSTTAVTGTVTVAGAVTEATLDAALIAQEATTSGIKGVTAFGAVTTAKPTYVTAKSDALSLDTSGLLRVSLADTPANGNKLLVTPDLPSGASTAAKQPALGTAGTASADVITVQGIASMTALKVDGSATTQPVSAASLPLPTGASTSAKQPALGTAGTASADVLTVQGITSMTALKVDGSAVTQPVSGTGSFTVVQATAANLNAQVVGAGAQGATVTGNPLRNGRRAATTNPTAVTDGQNVDALADKLGRTAVTIGHVRDQVTDSGVITLTTTTETTLLAAAGAGVFTDLTAITLANTSATAVRCDVRDVTAGTVRWTFEVPASGTTGLSWTRPLKQATANSAWTVQLSGAVTDVRICAQFEKNA